MDVRIGITQSVREIELDMADEGRDSLQKDVAAALAAATSATDTVLWLTDRKGRTVGVPAAKIAYVEIGSVQDERKVGFAR